MRDVDQCLQRLMSLQGVQGASLVDCPSGTALGSRGSVPDLAGAQASVMLQATMRLAATTAVGRPGEVEDIVVTTDDRYHLLQPLSVGLSDRLMLHVCLDRTDGNVAMTRHRIRTLAAEWGVGRE